MGCFLSFLVNHVHNQIILYKIVFGGEPVYHFLIPVDVELKLREDEEEELELCSIFMFLTLVLLLLLFLFICFCPLGFLVWRGAWVDVSDGDILEEGADGVLDWLDWDWASEMTTAIASNSVMVTNLLIFRKFGNYTKRTQNCSCWSIIS